MKTVSLEVRINGDFPEDIEICDLENGIYLEWAQPSWSMECPTKLEEFRTLAEAMKAYPIKDNLKMMERLIAAGLV